MTQHEQYTQQVRERLNKTIRLVHAPTSGRGRKTKFTTFADEMATVARERDEWPWKQKDLSSTGTPKDLPNRLRLFAEGKAGMTSRALSLIEMTCIIIENRARQTAKPAVEQSEHLAETSEYEVGDPYPRIETAPLGPLRIAPVGNPPEVDDEINAMREIVMALDNLDSAALRRVLAWANDKFLWKEGDN